MRRVWWWCRHAAALCLLLAGYRGTAWPSIIAAGSGALFHVRICNIPGKTMITVRHTCAKTGDAFDISFNRTDKYRVAHVRIAGNGGGSSAQSTINLNDTEAYECPGCRCSRWVICPCKKVICGGRSNWRKFVCATSCGKTARIGRSQPIACGSQSEASMKSIGTARLSIGITRLLIGRD